MTDNMSRQLKNALSLGVALVAVGFSVVVMLHSLVDLGGIPKQTIIGVAAGILGSAVAGMLSWLYRRSVVKGKHGTLFVSYSFKDKKDVDRLVKDLREDGYTVQTPEDIIQVGDLIDDRIAQSISMADGIILAMSENALKSDWTKRELQLAKERGKRLFPVLLGKAELPDDLAQIMYVDLSDSYDQGFRKLERSLNAYLSTQSADKDESPNN